jgi:hypothetical protein
MKLKAILIASGALACVLFLALFAIRAMVAQNVGRYVLRDGNPLILCDSTNGECWVATEDDNGEDVWGRYVTRFRKERRHEPRRPAVEMPPPADVQARPASE